MRDCFGKETVPLFKKNKGYILDKIYVLHKIQLIILHKKQ